MFDLFGDKELARGEERLQKAVSGLAEIHDGLSDFLLALRELNNPEVDRLFRELQAKVRVGKPGRGNKCH